MDSQKVNPATTSACKKRVVVPISLTIFVPVDMMIEAEAVDIDGQPTVVVNESDMDLIERALTAANKNPAVIEAIDALYAGLTIFKSKYPAVKAKLNPFVGVLSDRDL